MMNTEGNRKPDTLRSIQLLRALAALSVVYVHCTAAGDYNFPSAGHFGVDIFFIISGFIIAYMVSLNTEKFFIKRVIRIVPLYFLATVAMTLTVIVFPKLIHNTPISLTAFIKSVLFIPMAETNGQPILGQGWTLDYEMFFYIIMFLCIAFVKNKKYLTIACGASLVFVIISTTLLRPDSFIISYLGSTLLFEFIYGMVLYHLYTFSKEHKNKISINPAIKISLLSMLAIAAYGFLMFSDFVDFRISTHRCIFYGVPAFVVVSSVLFLESNLKDNKYTRFGVTLGEASYAMYLIHYHIVGLLSRIVFNKTLGPNSPFIIELMKVVVTFIVTIFFSIIVHRFIDEPIQKYLRKFIKNKAHAPTPIANANEPVSITGLRYPAKQSVLQSSKLADDYRPVEVFRAVHPHAEQVVDAPPPPHTALHGVNPESQVGKDA